MEFQLFHQGRDEPILEILSGNLENLIHVGSLIQFYYTSYKAFTLRLTTLVGLPKVRILRLSFRLELMGFIFRLNSNEVECRNYIGTREYEMLIVH